MKVFALLTVAVALVLVGCSKEEAAPTTPKMPDTNAAPKAP